MNNFGYGVICITARQKVAKVKVFCAEERKIAQLKSVHAVTPCRNYPRIKLHFLFELVITICKRGIF